MLNEKNIPKFISYLPSLGIVFITMIFTLIIIINDYNKLKSENILIKDSYIKEEKEKLINIIHEVIKYKKYIERTDVSTKKLQENLINYTKEVISRSNGYVFIIDNKANIISHPTIASGTNMWNLKDKNDLYIAQSYIAKTKQNLNGAFVSYYWQKPNEIETKRKTSFSYLFKDWNWIIATGTYLNDVEKKIEIKTSLAHEKINENISYTVIISILLIIITLFISFFFSKLINKIFLKYRRDVVLKERKLRQLNRNLKKLAKEEIRKRYLKEKELETVYIERLTRLPNRLKLSEILREEDNNKLAILNIDRFMDINNFYSPNLADELLKEIAKLIINTFKNKKQIKIFKLPVDEYAIYTNDESITDLEFKGFCTTIINLIEKQPLKVENSEIIVSITAGISLSNENTFINADTALKIAKEKNKDFFIYDKKDITTKNFQNNIKWTKILKDAIKEDQVTVYKQAIIANDKNTNKKYECLIRIKQSDGTVILPSHFLDLSKKIKVYPQLTKIVVYKSFKYFSNTKSDFSINLTLEDITNKDTVNYIICNLEKFNIAKQVIFEIVESEGIDKFEEVSLFINKMKEYGCRIAIDDFGTGYSNFEYLMKLNIDYIKIDGSFIKNINSNKQSELIASLIITFAKKQGISTVAEFVHNQDILNKVKDMGIDYSQGYYLGKPKEL